MSYNSEPSPNAVNSPSAASNEQNNQVSHEKKKIKKSMLRALDKQFRWLPLPTLLKLLMQALLDSGWIACISPHYLQVLDAAHMLPKNQAE